MANWAHRHYIIIHTSEQELATEIATGATTNPANTGVFNLPVFTGDDFSLPATYVGTDCATTAESLPLLQARMGELTSLIYARVDPDTYDVEVSNYLATGSAAIFEDLVTAAGLCIETGDK